MYTYLWILKHIALKTQHWENRTPLKTERLAWSDGDLVWTGLTVLGSYIDFIDDALKRWVYGIVYY